MDKKIEDIRDIVPTGDELDLDAQSKPVEGEYRVGMQGGCHCVFKPDGMILLFGEDDEALVALVASLLNRQAREIERLMDVALKHLGQAESAVGGNLSLQAQLTTTQERVEELELNELHPDNIAELFDKPHRFWKAVMKIVEQNHYNDIVESLLEAIDNDKSSVYYLLDLSNHPLTSENERLKGACQIARQDGMIYACDHIDKLNSDYEQSVGGTDRHQYVRGWNGAIESLRYDTFLMRKNVNERRQALDSDSKVDNSGGEK